MDPVMIAWLVALGVLFILAAFFSGSETALISLSRTRLQVLMERRPSTARGIRMWMEDPNRVLTTLLMGFNLVTVSASALASAMAVQFAEAFGLSRGWLVTGMAAMVGLVIIIFGEIAPKIFSLHQAERVVVWCMPPLVWFDRLITPFTTAFTWVAMRALGWLGQSAVAPRRRLTTEDIKALLAAGEREGAIDRHERQMLHSVLEFGDITVTEVMTPREMIEGVDLLAPRDTLIDRLVETGHTRVPVYEGSLDHLRGIVYAKDLLIALRDRDVIVVEDMIRPAYLVPADTRVNELLREFKTRRTHVALVTALGGRVVGLVAMHDPLEEIVGEILEEYVLEGAAGGGGR